MRRLILAALGVFAVSGVASAQQPPYQQPPTQFPTYSPGAIAATPVQPAAGVNVIRGNGGCTNCGPATAPGAGPVIRGAFAMSSVTGGNCALGAPCQNGCGSVKSDLAFHFGTCKQFFSPCGPTSGLMKHGCGTVPFAAPFGTGFGCPRAYDSYSNH